MCESGVWGALALSYFDHLRVKQAECDPCPGQRNLEHLAWRIYTSVRAQGPEILLSNSSLRLSLGL